MCNNNGSLEARLCSWMFEFPWIAQNLWGVTGSSYWQKSKDAYQKKCTLLVDSSWSDLFTSVNQMLHHSQSNKSSKKQPLLAVLVLHIRGLHRHLAVTFNFWETLDRSSIVSNPWFLKWFQRGALERLTTKVHNKYIYFNTAYVHRSYGFSLKPSSDQECNGTNQTLRGCP